MCPGASSRRGQGVLNWVKTGFVPSSSELFNVAGLGLLVLQLYAGLYLAIGSPFLPSGPAWAVLFIWLIAQCGGWVADRVLLPAPLGMILAGMALRNIDNGSIIRGLPASWSKEIRAAALAIIFLRSGLEIDLKIFRRVGPAAVRLLLIPGIVEAFYDGGLAIALFNMPATFAFALGFILKAVGPALVIQAMFEVQQRRLGVAKAIPATVVGAASLDDMVAITGYTIFINVAVRQEGVDPAWAIARGPLGVLFGVLAGALAALFCSATKLWNNKYKRTAVVFFAALLMKYFFDKYHFDSGGALGSLTLGLVVKELWARNWPGVGVLPDSNHDYTRLVEKHVRWFWKFVMMPLLFGLIGTRINFATLEGSTIPKSVIIVVTGLLCVRMPVTFLVMCKAGYTFREKLFFAAAWSPKATVQAALAASPLDAVNAAYPDRDSQEYRDYARWAEEALTTAVFCILVCGSVGTIIIRWFGPLLLDQTPEEAEQAFVPSTQPDPLEGRGNQAGEENYPMGPGAPPAPHVPKEPSGSHWAAVEAELLRAQDRGLAAHLERLQDLAAQLAGRSGATGSELADKLQSNILALRHRLLEEVGEVLPEDVEGADDFLRATSRPASLQLRHRHRGGGSPRAGARASSSAAVGGAAREDGSVGSARGGEERDPERGQARGVQLSAAGSSAA